MSAVRSAKLKANCDAVNSGQFIINQPISTNSPAVNSKAAENANHGTKLNKKQDPVDIKREKSHTKAKPNSDNFQLQSQKLNSDVQKVLKQEQELQKQLYSGSNVAPGWLRVNHHNKVIYIRWVSKLLHIFSVWNWVGRKISQRKIPHCEKFIFSTFMSENWSPKLLIFL